ncbi:MAG TPA: hypothetical protein VEB21_07700 [Terriglobales bacterium]|nr:hypothetical protein [Terriglobales bacterium]
MRTLPLLLWMVVLALAAPAAGGDSFEATPVPPDAYEPDDSRAQARPFACGSSQFHTFDGVLDLDWVSFSLTERSQVLLLPSDNATFELEMTLFVGNDIVAEARHNIRHLCGADALGPGSYDVAIARRYFDLPLQLASYRLTLACLPCPPNDAPPSATPTASSSPTPTAPPPDAYEPDDLGILASTIGCGETQRHTISPQGDADWFRFTLTEPSQVIVRPRVSDGERFVCAAYGGADQEDSDCVDRPTARVCGVDALPAGDHIFVVHDWQALTYDVSLLCLSCDLPNPSPTPTRTYSWPQPPPSPTAPPTDIYEPDDDRDSAKAITCGTVQMHTISPAYESDWLAIDLRERSQLVVRVDGGVWAELSDAAGDTIVGGAPIERVCGIDALDRGRYFVRIDGSSRPYEVAVECLPCDLPNLEPTPTWAPYPTPTFLPADSYEPDDSLTAATRISCGEMQRRTISPPGDTDWSTFLLGETSQVVVTSTSGTRIGVRDSSGTLLRSDFHQVAHACGADALPPGAYSIAIDREYERVETSPYQLTIACAPCDLANSTPSPTPTPSAPPSEDAYEPDNDAPEAKAIACGDVQSRRLAPGGDVDWVSFAVSEPTEMLVLGHAPDGQTLIDLRDEQGAALGWAHDRLERRCGGDPLAPGNYFLVVSEGGYLDDPQYDLSLTCVACPTPPPTPTATATATPTPPPYADRSCPGVCLCSGGAGDGLPCSTFRECRDGACVIAQGICADGFICDCPAGTCSNDTGCPLDQTFGTCAGGPADTSCCDVALNCAPGDSCVAAHKACVGGFDQGFSCTNSSQCRRGRCASTGCFCDGGDFDGYTCVTGVDCPGGGACMCVPAPPSSDVPCAGDCSRDDAVSVDELLIGINIALGDGTDVDLCPSFDADHNRIVTVDEVLAAMTKALGGC